MKIIIAKNFQIILYTDLKNKKTLILGQKLDLT